MDPGRKLSAQRLSPRSNNSKGISTSSSKTTASSPPKQNRSTSKGEPAPGPPASAQVNHRQGQRRCDRTASLSIPARSRRANPPVCRSPYKLVLRAVLAKRNAEYFSDLSPRLPKSRERAKGPTVRAGCHLRSGRSYCSSATSHSACQWSRSLPSGRPSRSQISDARALLLSRLRSRTCESSSANGASHLKAESVEIICPGEVGQRS